MNKSSHLRWAFLMLVVVSHAPAFGGDASGDVAVRTGATADTPPTKAAPASADLTTPNPSGADGPAQIRVLTDDERRGMALLAHRPGCPVPLADLRVVEVRHLTPSGATLRGRVVVHERVASDIAAIFDELYAARFPLERVTPVERYDGDDDRSMAANNTSAFNCRAITGSARRFSNHAYGLAIDVNPLWNPYVRGAQILPPEGAAFVARAPPRPGQIVANDVVVRAFQSRGFKWGGDYRRHKDWQHFEKDPSFLKRVD